MEPQSPQRAESSQVNHSSNTPGATVAADRSKQILDALPLPVVTLSAEGVIVDANRAAGGLKGGAIGRNFRDFVSAQDAGRVEEALERAARGETARLEIGYWGLDGAFHNAEVTITPSPEGSEPAVAVAILRNTSAEREARRELVQLTKLATVGELLAGISHELNNPLTAVIAYAELLASQKDLPEEIREDLADLRRQALRAAKIVKQLLALVRESEPIHVPVDLNAIVRDTVSLREGAIKRASIEVELDLGGLPLVQGDQFRLQQLVLNLLTNAEYAAAHGKRPRAIKLSTRATPQGVELEVRDSGEGIPEDLFPRLFDPFVTTKRAGEGTGLGLAIAKQIAVEHGGNIAASNAPDGGAVFKVALPPLQAQ
ncbi:Sensor histidine kinase TmoS [bacterium HR33]|nr:Sensor histidine kinase TmoS [bacterium HR33]